jgi:hypothetical protein
METRMETLKDLLLEFPIFDFEIENPEADENNDNNDELISQDNLEINDPEDLQSDDCQCSCDCPCCQKHREDKGQGSVDDNIEIIEPEDKDHEDGSDPFSDYNKF